MSCSTRCTHQTSLQSRRRCPGHCQSSSRLFPCCSGGLFPSPANDVRHLHRSLGWYTTQPIARRAPHRLLVGGPLHLRRESRTQHSVAQEERLILKSVSITHSRTNSWVGLTLVDLHLGDGLPTVHCDEPCVILSAATQIQHKLRLVAIQGRED